MFGETEKLRYFDQSILFKTSQLRPSIFNPTSSFNSVRSGS